MTNEFERTSRIAGFGSSLAELMLKCFRGMFAQLKYLRARLRRLLLNKTTFIAITGSCGKTSTTELTAAVLSAWGKIVCAERTKQPL